MTAGPATVRTFEVSGVRFEYVLHAPEGTNADIDRLVKARAVVEAAGALMGGFPFKRYVFHSVCDRANGGLEHDDSTVMILRPWSFGSDAGYRRAAAARPRVLSRLECEAHPRPGARPLRLCRRELYGPALVP